MTSRAGFAAWTIFTALALAGCASGYVQETTRLLASDVTTLQGGVGRYVTGQQELAARRIDRVMKERRQLAEGDEELEAQLQTRDGAAGLYATALAGARSALAKEKTTAERMLNEREALKNTQTPFDPELAKKLQGLASQLTGLGTPASAKEQAKFVFEYFKEIGKAVKQAEKAASDSADKAEAPASGESR